MRAVKIKELKKKSQTTVPPFRKRTFLLLLVLFTFLVYGNSIRNGYALDDEFFTNNHPLTSRGLEALPEIFGTHSMSHEDGASYSYRPVVLLSFAIEHQLFGEDPHISHFINVLIYALSIC